MIVVILPPAFLTVVVVVVSGLTIVLVVIVFVVVVLPPTVFVLVTVVSTCFFAEFLAIDVSVFSFAFGFFDESSVVIDIIFDGVCFDGVVSGLYFSVFDFCFFIGDFFGEASGFDVVGLLVFLAFLLGLTDASFVFFVGLYGFGALACLSFLEGDSSNFFFVSRVSLTGVLFFLDGLFVGL